jgi:hypothetical protein
VLVSLMLASACTDSGTTVTVLNDTAASLTITVSGDAPGANPSTVVLDVGDSLSLVASATNALGLAVQTGTVAWASSDVAVVQVSSVGLLQAVGPGSAGVLAASDGVTATISVSVNDTVTLFPSPAP